MAAECEWVSIDAGVGQGVDLMDDQMKELIIKAAQALKEAGALEVRPRRVASTISFPSGKRD